MKITYRPAALKDTGFLFVLKNDRDVRMNSIYSHRKIPFKPHKLWMEKHVHEITIILADGMPVGDVRIEENEISIKLLPAFRGKGIGGQAIKELSRKGQVAKIVEGNIGSMRIFVQNGFNFTGYEKGYYTLCK